LAVGESRLSHRKLLSFILVEFSTYNLCGFSGGLQSLADYAEELTTETSEVPEHLAYYIDYERMGRDMEMSGDIFTVETGYQEVHVFWAH